MNDTISRIGNMLAFGLVLIILGLGGYIIYGIIQQDWDFFTLGGTEELRPTAEIVMVQPTLTPFEGMVVQSTATATPLFQQPTPAPPTATSEPAPEATAPPTFTALPTSRTSATPLPSPTSAYAVPTATSWSTATPIPTAKPIPTPVPPTATPAFLFRVSATGPSYERGCDGHYIFGYIRDSAGTPLPGMRVRVYGQHGHQIPPATSKQDPRGWYDVPISSNPNTWYVQVVDAGNSPLSQTVRVVNTGNFVEGSEACWHQVDFTRTN